MPDRIPLVDLAATTEPVVDGWLRDAEVIATSGGFLNSPVVEAFERAWASYCGARECVAVGSGLDALRLALVAAGVEGQEVVVPAMTFVATADAVVQAGARLVLVDVDDDGLLPDYPSPPRFAGFVVPVHLHGQVARAPGGVTVHDACQAHGAELPPGAAACFSFYPSKNLGAFGDAGSIVTDDAALAARARALRNHGYDHATREHVGPGWTARMDALQAAVLLRKLPFLGGWNLQREEQAARYGFLLEGVGDLRLPRHQPGRVWHVYAVRTADPGGLAGWLAERGVQTGRHYAHAVHQLPAYSWPRWGDYGPGDFPGAERFAAETLSLPLYPGLTTAQQERVADAVRAWFASVRML